MSLALTASVIVVAVLGFVVWLFATNHLTRRMRKSERLITRTRPKLDDMFTAQGFELRSESDYLGRTVEYRRIDEGGDTITARAEIDAYGQQGKVRLTMSKDARGKERYSESVMFSPFSLFGFNAGYVTSAIRKASRKKLKPRKTR